MATATYTCELCGREFANRYALGPHKRACWNALNKRVAPVSSDFSNSDSSSDEEEESVSPVTPDVEPLPPPPVSASIPSISAPVSSAFSVSDADESIASPVSESVAIAHPNVSLWELAQRSKDWGVRRLCPTQGVADYNADMTFSYIPVSLFPTLSLPCYLLFYCPIPHYICLPSVYYNGILYACVTDAEDLV